MKNNFKPVLVGFALGLAMSAAGAQAAMQATQHEHPTPPAQKPAPDGAKGMDATNHMGAMMADPAMRQKMMENMSQCRDMMSMMMQHMGHDGKMTDKSPAQHKH